MDTYDTYKNSEVEWIGEIPSHWEKSKLKYKGKFFSGYSFDSNDFLEEGKVRVLKISNIQNMGISWNDLQFLPEHYYYEFENFQVHKGDLVFVLTRPIVSTGIKVCFYEEDFNTLLNQRNSVFRPDETKISKRFLFYSVRTFSFVEEFKQQLKETNQPNISTDQISNILMFCPPFFEQQQIVSFLDTKTFLIDSLIEKTQKKIELLKEQRISLINEVVTKGLNPNVELKDSGIEWIGEIPSHWKMKKVKYLFEIRKRISGELGFDVLSVTQKGLKVKDIISGKGQVSMDYTKYQIVKEGDFVMNHMDLLTGYVDVSSQLGVTSPDYRVFTLMDTNSDSDFYLSIFQFGYQNKIFYGFGQGSSMFGRWRLPSRQFNEFKFPYPTLKEQREIVKHLNKQEEIIDNTLQLEQKRIELLKEYRQSLISEVVTGKIKVTD